MSLRFVSDANDLVLGILPGLQVMPTIFTALAFTLLYVAVPNCKVPVKAAAQAGVLAAVLFELAKRLFGLFVANFSSYQFVYGAFAAFPIFLIWIYVSWMIVLLGVEVSRALTLFKEQHYSHRHPVLAMLDVLQLFLRRQQEGHSVSDTEAMSVLGRYEVEIWSDMANLLLNLNYIKKTENGNYVLVRNLDRISFWEFYQQLPWHLPRPEDMQNLHADDNWARELAPHLQRVHEAGGRELDLPLGKILSVD
jgi:membrane protein